MWLVSHRHQAGRSGGGGERLQRALCCSHPVHRACALTWFLGACGPPSVSRYHPGEPWPWLFTLLGLQLCQPHGTAHAMQPTWVLGSPWLSLSSGTVKADIPLGPAAGSALGKTQLCRELLCWEKKSFTRKFPARRAVRFPGCRVLEMEASASPPQARGAGGACVCSGIHSPAEGTLLFLSGLDALQEQSGELNSVAAKALRLQVKTS